jgi:hypothetical protein
MVVRGPETRPSRVPVPAHGAWLGVRFATGAVLRGIEMARLVDRSLPLPMLDRDHFWLGGRAWEIPTFENAEQLVDAWADAGLLFLDRLVVDAWAASSRSVGQLRTRQRRFVAATGLTRQHIAVVSRAHLAVNLLRENATPRETALVAGYADQAHLTRSLKRFVGLTPGQLRTYPGSCQLSFIPQRDPS